MRVHTVEKRDYMENVHDLRVGQFASSVAQSALEQHQVITVHKIS